MATSMAIPCAGDYSSHSSRQARVKGDAQVACRLVALSPRPVVVQQLRPSYLLRPRSGGMPSQLRRLLLSRPP